MGAGGGSALGGVVCLVLAGLLMWKKKLPKVSTVLALVGAVCLGGAAARWLGVAGGFVLRLLDSVGLYLLGVAVSAFVLIPLLFIVVHDLLPKGKANRTTQAAAFAMPFLGLATSGAIGAAITSASLAIGSAVASLTTSL